MTVGKAITEIRKDKPNAIDEYKLISWLEDLDMRVNAELLEPYGNGVELTKYTPDTELLIPDTYRRIYLYWLSAMIDYTYQEIDLYNNDYVMFNSLWESYTNWYGNNNSSSSNRIKMRY